jgi:catechol 2,3-dioxygenase-like lactoylglutathione lyase family enzyme
MVFEPGQCAVVPGENDSAVSPDRSWHRGGMVHVGVVALGVDDVERAARFWCEALGYDRREDGFGGWSTVLVPRSGSGTMLALQRSDRPADPYPRMHLDLHVASAVEQAREVERLVALGAAPVDWDRYPADPDFVVLADPAGNRFCVVDLSHG